MGETVPRLRQMRNACARLFPVLFLLALLAGCASSPPGESTENVHPKTIPQEEAREILESGRDVMLVDVRTEEEYAAEHIPGAICIPNETIGEEMPAELPDREQKILVYCRTGRRSAEAAQKLAAMGYTDVNDFGGIVTWTGPTEK